MDFKSLALIFSLILGLWVFVVDSKSLHQIQIFPSNASLEYLGNVNSILFIVYSLFLCQFATEAAITILRIDDMIKLVKDESQGEDWVWLIIALIDWLWWWWEVWLCPFQWLFCVYGLKLPSGWRKVLLLTEEHW